MNAEDAPETPRNAPRCPDAGSAAQAGPTPNPAIQAAYENAVAEVLDLAAGLPEAVMDAYPPPDGETPVHWTTVGDMRHIATLLKELHAFIAGKAE